MAKKETKIPLTEQQRKNYLIAAVLMIVVLSLISLISKNQKFAQPAVTTGPGNETTVVSDLGTVTDLKASQQISREIFDSKTINDEVTQDLGTNQPIIIPAIADSELKSEANSQQNVANYLQSLDQKIKDYNYKTEDITKNMFSDSVTAASLDDAYNATQSLISDLYATPVPKDAFTLHKAIINSYVSYAAMIKIAKNYNLGIDQDPSKEIYASTSTYDVLSSTINSEMQNLTQKYKIQFK